MVDASPKFVHRFIQDLKHHPVDACKSFSVINRALRKPRTRNARARLIENLAGSFDNPTHLLLLFEHCFQRHKQMSTELGEPFNSRSLDYIKNLLEFLGLWITFRHTATEEIFRSGIFVNFICELPEVEVCTSCPDISRYLAYLLRYFLNDEHRDISTWAKVDVHQLHYIVESFSKVCVDSNDIRLIDLFLEVVQRFTCGDHDNDVTVRQVFMQYLTCIENKIDDRAFVLEDADTKRYFTRQMHLYRQGFRGGLFRECKPVAKALKLVVLKLCTEETRQKMEMVAIKEVLLRDLMKIFEPRRQLHDRFVNEVLGRVVVTSRFERIHGQFGRNDAPSEAADLPSTHPVFEFLEEDKRRFPFIRTRGVRVSGIRVTKRQKTEQEQGLVWNRIDPIKMSDLTLSSTFVQFYRDDIDRQMRRLMPILLGDDIDFGLPSRGDDCSDESSVQSTSLVQMLDP